MWWLACKVHVLVQKVGMIWERPLLEGRGMRGVHREEGFKASEGCLGVFQAAKDMGIPGPRWDSRSGVGLGNVPESTWHVSGRSEGIMSPECEHTGLRERKKAGPWVGDKG